MAASILALGAGAMGETAAKTVAAFDEVGRLTVADLSLDAARRVALGCAGKGEAAAVDVTDHAALVALMRGHDAVMNCVGPFFRFGLSILEAALEAGVDYLDICDDPAPTRDMLDLDEAARSAGVTAVVGMGASPGVTNLLGALVKARLDTVDTLAAAWNIEEKTAGGDQLAFSAAIVHWLAQCSGEILECVDGKLAKVRPLADVAVDYPGRGERTLYTVGHPEPVSFHATWPDIRRTYCDMVMPSAWIGLFRKYQGLIDSGAMPLDAAAKAFFGEASCPTWWDALLTGLSRLVDGPRLPYFFVLGQGRAGGRKKTVAASIAAMPPDMAGATGVPLALGTLLLLRGQIGRKGVMAPEAAFSPEAFFALYAPYCTLPKPLPPEQLVVIDEADA